MPKQGCCCVYKYIKVYMIIYKYIYVYMIIFNYIYFYIYIYIIKYYYMLLYILIYNHMWGSAAPNPDPSSLLGGSALETPTQTLP